MDSPLSDQENMSPKKKESIIRRKALRTLLSEMREIGETESVDREVIHEVGNKLRKINELDEEVDLKDRVQFYEEIFLDSDVLSCAADYLKQSTFSIDISKTYEPQELARNIKSRLEFTNKKDLLKLKNIANDIKLVTQIKPYTYTYGTFKFNQVHVIKQKKERVIKSREELNRKAPETVATVTAEEQNIEEIVSGLFNVLRDEYIKNKEKPINYYDYVIDTNDFGATIENIFHFSFLIRNGRAQLDLDSKGNPIIKPVSKSALKEYRSQHGANAQVITSINFDEWEKFKKPGFLQKHKQSTT